MELGRPIVFGFFQVGQRCIFFFFFKFSEEGPYQRKLLPLIFYYPQYEFFFFLLLNVLHCTLSRSSHYFLLAILPSETHRSS